MDTKKLEKSWKQFRGGFQEAWEKLGQDDSHLIDTKLDQVIELLQDRYGHTQKQASKLIARRLRGYSHRRAHMFEELSDHLTELPTRKLWLLGGAVLSLLFLVRFTAKLLND